jgi:hypothetical protein
VSTTFSAAVLEARGGSTKYVVSCQPGPHEVAISVDFGSLGLMGMYEQLVVQICTRFAHSDGERSPSVVGLVEAMQ